MSLEPTVVVSDNAACEKGALPEIDRRSFNVFEHEGTRLMFDRATGTTCELNDLAYDVLTQLRRGTALNEVLEGLSDPDAREEIVAALTNLKNRGFFRFWTVEPASDEDLRPLWEHKPMRIQMLMAEGCNLGCRYCYQWRNGTNQKHTLMPWSVARDAIHHLIWKSGSRTDLQITFFGGEPLLNYPMVKRVVEYCRSLEESTGKKFLFELITNGTLLTKEVTDFIVKEKFLLFISLDGWKEMHNYNRPSLTGDDAMYDTILQNALYANQQYIKHKLNNVKVRANLTGRYHDQAKVVAYFESLGFRLIGVGAIEPLPHGDPSPAALTEDQMDELHRKSEAEVVEAVKQMELGIPLGAYMKKTINQVASPLAKRQWHGITCGIGRNTTIVDNRGNMYPCHRYAEMQAFNIGNVSTGLDREKVMAYYRKINSHSTESCQDCWIRDYCSGGCAWLLSDKDGNIHNPTARECDRRRRSMEQALWVRQRLRKAFPNRFDAEQEQPLEAWDWDAVAMDDAADGCSNSFSEMGNPIREAPALTLPTLNLLPASGGGCGTCPSSSGGGGCGCHSVAPAGLTALQNPGSPVIE